MAFIPPQGNKTVMVDSGNNIVYPASFQKVVATQATIAGNNFTDVPSVIDPENATTTQLPSVASVVSYVSDVVEGGSSGLIPAIQSDIQTLGQVKSNRGEFYFGGGANSADIIKLNSFGIPLSFSLAFRLKAYDSQTGTLSYLFRLSNGLYVARQSGLRVEKYTSTNTKEKTLIAPTNIEAEIFDGNWHSIIVTCTTTTLSLYYEKGLIKTATGNFTDIQPNLLRMGGGGGTSGFGGQMADIKIFNFDMSDNNAPYTIADYINGKDESPLLYGGAYNFNSQSDWLAFLSNEGTFTSTGNDLTFTASEDVTANYLVFYVNANVKAGTKVEALIDSVVNNSSATISKYSISAGATATNDAGSSPSSNTLFGTQTSFTTTKDSNKLAFWIWKTGTFATGETLTLVNPQIRVNGALLSLDDYSIKVGATQIVPDVSGNNNDATIIGSVYGSKDNSIAKMAQLFYQSQQG